MRGWLFIGLAGMLVSAAVLFAALRPHSAAGGRQRLAAPAMTAAQSARLEPANFGALHTAATLVGGVPRAAETVGLDYRPTPGQVHRLGPNGMMLAWLHGTEVCEAEASGWGCVPSQPGPIELTAEDPDVVGQGQPPRALGLAVDGVVDVKVILDDGRSAHAAPVDNFYSIELPADAKPPFPMTVEAAMSDGSVYRTHVPR